MRLASDDSGDTVYRCFLPGFEGFGETTLSVGERTFHVSDDKISDVNCI